MSKKLPTAVDATTTLSTAPGSFAATSSSSTSAGPRPRWQRPAEPQLIVDFKTWLRKHRRASEATIGLYSPRLSAGAAQTNGQLQPAIPQLVADLGGALRGQPRDRP